MQGESAISESVVEGSYRLRRYRARWDHCIRHPAQKGDALSAQRRFIA